MRLDRPSREPVAVTDGAADAASSRDAGIAEAVDRFQSGADREESFRRLYMTFFPAVRRFFARKGMSPEDCLDLTQETFFGIYRGLDGFRSDARFETWLYRVATTTYLKSLRAEATAKRAGRKVSLEETVAVDPALESPAAQLEGVLRDERSQAMEAAVQELPEQMRKCLTLRLYHQLAYREIAEVMKLNVETVKVHLFKARKRLKESLRGYALEGLSSEAETAE